MVVSQAYLSSLQRESGPTRQSKYIVRFLVFGTQRSKYVTVVSRAKTQKEPKMFMLAPLFHKANIGIIALLSDLPSCERSLNTQKNSCVCGVGICKFVTVS